MSTTTLVTVFGSLAFILLLACLIFFKIKIGRVDTKNPLDAMTRRNNIVIAVILLCFLIFLIGPYFLGRIDDPEIPGWKAALMIIALVSGGASVILLIFGSFRRKK